MNNVMVFVSTSFVSHCIELNWLIILIIDVINNMVHLVME